MNRVICAPLGSGLEMQPSDLRVVLYEHQTETNVAAAGAPVLGKTIRLGLAPAARAWDLLSIALSIIATDHSIRRCQSPDGWTRELDVRVAVTDVGFWATQSPLLNQLLRFLTTDVWDISFVPGGLFPASPENPFEPTQDCITLLSGGLDSLVGAIDLVRVQGRNPYPVSQVARGDTQKQALFASRVGLAPPLQLNHDARCPGQSERSQRARSVAFFAYGVLMATALRRYHEGEPVDLFVCENGFISVNPPLTASRLGSLSTRTTHPVYMRLFQQLLDNAGLRVSLRNPYQFRTKGEMLRECADQELLRPLAHRSTSCGRFARYRYSHCGRCVPCLIRRASFLAWGVDDATDYAFPDLSQDDEDHAGYDDVRCAAVAVASAREEGTSRWARLALGSSLPGDVNSYVDVVGRGLDELAGYLGAQGLL